METEAMSPGYHVAFARRREEKARTPRLTIDLLGATARVVPGNRPWIHGVRSGAPDELTENFIALRSFGTRYDRLEPIEMTLTRGGRSRDLALPTRPEGQRMLQDQVRECGS